MKNKPGKIHQFLSRLSGLELGPHIFGLLFSLATFV
jgi:hypothetical protein